MNTETVIRYLTMAVVVVTSLPVHELAPWADGELVGRPYGEGPGKADSKSVCTSGFIWNSCVAAVWIWLGKAGSDQSEPF